MKKITSIFLCLITLLPVWGYVPVNDDNFSYLIDKYGTDDAYAMVYGKEATGVFSIGTMPTADRNIPVIHDLVIPDSVAGPNKKKVPVTVIGAYAFMKCNNITGTLTIPNTIRKIDKYAFYECSGLAGFEPNEGLEEIGEYAFSQYNITGKLNMPSTLKTIGNYAFQECTGLTGLELNEGLEKIGNNAFKKCQNIAGKLIIPGTVKVIGNYAFSECTGLTSLELNEGLEEIGDGAFFFLDDESLRGKLAGDLVIPNTVHTIGAKAFKWAYYHSKSNPKTLTLSNSLISLKREAFYGCWGFKGTLRIPGTITKISDNAFTACANISEIVIEKGVEEIEGFAFNRVGVNHKKTNGEKGLERVTLPRTLRKMGATSSTNAAAFANTNIDIIDIYAEVPPTMLSQQFTAYTLDNGTFFVPCTSTEAYRTAYYWKDIAEGHIWGLDGDIENNPSVVSTKVKCAVAPAGAGTANYTWDCATRTYKLTCEPSSEDYAFEYWVRESENATEFIYDQYPEEVIVYQQTTFTAHFVRTSAQVYVADVCRWDADGVYVETETLDMANNCSYIARINSQYADKGEILSKDAGVFRMDINKLANHASKTLELLITTADDGMKMTTTIPVLINRNTTLPTTVTTNQEVIILDGSTLTIDHPATLRKLQVYEGGSLVVNSTLNVDTLILWDNATTGKHAQAYGIENITASNLFYDCLLNRKQYYAVALPGNADPNKVTHANGDEVAIGIKVYDGETRATGQSGWEKLTNANFTFEAGKGYALFATPRKWNGKQQSLAAVRFPLTNWNTDKTITIKAYQAEKEMNANWNLIGNPWMADLTGIEPNLLQYGYWAPNAEGKWEEQNTDVRYVVRSTDHYKTYLHEEASKANLPAFMPFFVQSIGNGTLTIGAPAVHNIALAPRKAPAAYSDNDDLMTGIVLESTNAIDKTGILIGDGFTEKYDFNADLAKIFGGTETLSLYTLLGTTPLAYCALAPEQAAQIIPLGFRTADTKSTLCFKYNDDYDIERVEAIWLTDTQTGSTTNLLYDNYCFTTTEPTNDARFYLQVVKRKSPDTTTAINDNAALQAFACSENGTLLISRIPENTTLYIYDINGRLIHNANHCYSTMRFSLPDGYYLVRLQTATDNQLLRTIVQ